ncbi:MAG TPA: hypothetical protein VKB63_09415 [Gemmatimonadales bacterium]|nr:hypothetical protein [Gemmatimonadales bacterium]
MTARRLLLALLVAAPLAAQQADSAQRGRVDGWADIMEMHEHMMDAHPELPGHEEHHP